MNFLRIYADMNTVFNAILIGKNSWLFIWSWLLLIYVVASYESLTENTPEGIDVVGQKSQVRLTV